MLTEITAAKNSVAKKNVAKNSVERSWCKQEIRKARGDVKKITKATHRSLGNN